MSKYTKIGNISNERNKKRFIFKQINFKKKQRFNKDYNRYEKKREIISFVFVFVANIILSEKIFTKKSLLSNFFVISTSEIAFSNIMV